MDLGCLDLGCVSFLDGTCNSRNKDDGTSDFVSAATAKVGKDKSPKESPQSNSSTVNRSTSQMKKPPSRKTSPINWFPRRKVDSYLKRKIKLLQEAGGMNSTLDETLGDANPHYCRVEREKIAVKEAARKAMEARKAAMVEASWCRILKAARINSKEAEALLLIAEKNVAEALEAATAKGVIMYATSDCPREKCVIQTSPANGKAMTSTHTVRASFETAFEVDKQVAAAVKTAFIQLANSPSSLNKDEYHDLLRKISENPDTDIADNQELSEFSSGCESDMGFEAELGSPDTEARPRKYRRRRSPQKSNTMNLVEMMFGRLKCLKEEELASLATIVATSGLGAALAEVGNNHKTPDEEEGPTRRRSNFGAGTIRSSSVDFFMNGPTGKKQVVQQPEFPSLDKVLVKHMTKLEREVQEARNLRVKESEGCELDPDRPEVPSLDKFLVKHVTRLEREVQEARNLRERESKGCELDPDRLEDLRVILEEDEMGSSSETALDFKDEHVKDFEVAKEKDEMKSSHEKPLKGAAMKFRSSQLRKKNQTIEENREVPSLDKFLVKHVTRLEREVQEAKKRRKEHPSKVEGEKENIDLNTQAEIATGSRNGVLPYTGKEKEQNELDDSNFESLDKVLIKSVPRLEKEKMELRAKEEGLKVEKKDKVLLEDQNGDCGLGQILLKHKSRLEREKEQMVAAAQESEQGQPRKQPSISCQEAREKELQEFWGGKSLGDSVRPQVPRLEREKAAAQPAVIGDEKPHSVSRREARERELQDAWGGMGLGNFMLPKFPRLEREKATAQPADVGDEKSYSVSRREAKQRELQEAWGGMDLGNSMCPQVSRLEREKAAAAQSADMVNEKTYSVSHREARERELQEAWGGMDLGNSMRPQVSRLEREKAAAAQSADMGNEKNHSISRKEARQRELQEAWGGMGLGNSMSPQFSRLEREKAAAAQFADMGNEKNHSISRKEARQRELQEAWGGVGLGNSMRPHVSRLEREKAVWMKAEEEERRAAAIPGL